MKVNTNKIAAMVTIITNDATINLAMQTLHELVTNEIDTKAITIAQNITLAKVLESESSDILNRDICTRYMDSYLAAYVTAYNFVEIFYKEKNND